MEKDDKASIQQTFSQEGLEIFSCFYRTPGVLKMNSYYSQYTLRSFDIVRHWKNITWITVRDAQSTSTIAMILRAMTKYVIKKKHRLRRSNLGHSQLHPVTPYQSRLANRILSLRVSMVGHRVNTVRIRPRFAFCPLSNIRWSRIYAIKKTIRPQDSNLELTHCKEFNYQQANLAWWRNSFLQGYKRIAIKGIRYQIRARYAFFPLSNL
jgi:hypothetical protein